MPQAPPYILTLLTFIPLFAALILALLFKKSNDLPDEHHHEGSDDDQHGEAPTDKPIPKDGRRTAINGFAIFVSVVQFALSILLFMSFNPGLNEPKTGNMQFIETADWIKLSGMNVQYKMGVDGISILLILLTTFLMLLCVMFSGATRQRHKEFMVFLLFLETGMIGVFCALDLVLFYVFWEAMLIPMYFLIGIFGHENRLYAAVKFFIYTFAGSIFMLIAIVWTYSVTKSFDLLALTDLKDPAGGGLAQYLTANPRAAIMMFGSFALAFAIKVPMFPFHTWLPDAHVEAPTAGSVILAGVMLKMGTYGFVRFCLPLFPEQSRATSGIFITLAIIGIVYGSLVAAVQTDAKKLVAYSSVAHLGFVVLGIFSFTQVGMMGALIQNINHGISTPMLFFLVGMLYDRRHTRKISEFGGLKMVTPLMATLLLIAVLSSIAVPFFNGFVGEFPILLGSFVSMKTGYWPTAIAASGMIWSAVYMLWWFQRLMLGPVTKTANRKLPDLRATEFAVLWPLAGLVFWIGLGSHFWTSRMETSVNNLIPVAADETDETLPMGQKLMAARRGESSVQNTSQRGRSVKDQFSDLIKQKGDPTVKSARPPAAGGGGGQPGGAPGGGNSEQQTPNPNSSQSPRPNPPISEPTRDNDQPVSSPPDTGSPANPNVPAPKTPDASVPGNPGGDTP